MNPYERYSTIQATTASKGTLVVMLYQGAIRFTRLALAAMGRDEIEGAHESLVKAQAIVDELRSGLDRSAGDLAERLEAIYDYLQRRLIEANIRKDQEIVQEVATLLSELLPAWVEAARASETASTSDRPAWPASRMLLKR